jgi:hypothetical protein
MLFISQSKTMRERQTRGMLHFKYYQANRAAQRVHRFFCISFSVRQVTKNDLSTRKNIVFFVTCLPELCIVALE